jgi:hypothetical protein
VFFGSHRASLQVAEDDVTNDLNGRFVRASFAVSLVQGGDDILPLFLLGCASAATRYR